MSAPDRPPNVLLVMTDQQRHDQLGRIDDRYDTPNLDGLAARGTTFETAYSSSTICAPARGSLLTGLFVHRYPGHTSEAAGGNQSLRQGHWTLPRQLQRAGYDTAHVGKAHYKPIRADHGFDLLLSAEHLTLYKGETPPAVDDYTAYLLWNGIADGTVNGLYQDGDPRQDEARRWSNALVFGHDTRHHATSWVTRQARRWLADRPDGRPWYLEVSYPHPHSPYNPPAEWAERYDPDDVDLPDAEQGLQGLAPHARAVLGGEPEENVRRWGRQRVSDIGPDVARRVFAHRQALIAQIDHSVGKLLADIDLDDTVVIFTSDHGDYGGHRGLISKIPAFPFDDLARVPFTIAGPGLPAERTRTEPVQSHDLVPTVLELTGAGGPVDQLDGRSLVPMLQGGVADPDRVIHTHSVHGFPMVRMGRHKLIADVTGGERMVFDLVADPYETVNRDGSSELADVQAELVAHLRELLAMTAPTLVTG